MRKNKRPGKLLPLLLLAALALCLSACGTSGPKETGSPKAETIRFGTGGIGGSYYSYGNALAQTAADAVEGLDFTVKSTAGSAANLRLLQGGFLQMAIVQNDTLYDAWNGTGLFADNACQSIGAIAGVYTETCQIIVPADSEIQTVADLSGKRVSVGEEESGVLQNARQILLANGLTVDMLEARYLSFADAAAAMEQGELDAFFITGGAPITAVATLAEKQPIRLLSLDEDTLAQMQKLYPAYSLCTIPAGTYAGMTEDVRTLGIKAVLVADSDLDNDTIRAITETLFTRSSAIQYATSTDTAPDATFATEEIAIPFHPGAAAYYQQQGLSVLTGSTDGTDRVYASQDQK